MCKQDCDILSEIKRRPNTYLTSKSLNALSDFVSGYRAGSSNASEADILGIASVLHFANWLKLYLKKDVPNPSNGAYPSSSLSWNSLIADSCESQEEAFDLFFILLDDFRTRVPYTLARAPVKRNDGNVAYHLSLPPTGKYLDCAWFIATRYGTEDAVYLTCIDDSENRRDFGYFTSLDKLIDHVEAAKGISRKEWIHGDTASN